MKKFFNTPQKAVLSIICIVVVAFILIAAISTIVIKNSLIGKSEAGNIALRDAGLNESEASGLRTRLNFDDRRFQYEVDFYNNGTEYEYVILAKNGDIIARNIEGDGNNPEQNAAGNMESDRSNPEQNAAGNMESDGSNPEQNASSNSENQTDSSAVNPNQNVQTSNPPVSDVTDSAQSQEISLEEAKAAALADANLSEAEVTFTKTKLDDDGRVKVYDIEFYTSDMKYDYEINAYDGTVQEKEHEAFSAQPENSAGDNAGNNYIGVERAKEIALNNANLNEADVQFVKAKLENDDGKVEYEIEFYFDRTEYSYTIDAVSGNILEYDTDLD